MSTLNNFYSNMSDEMKNKKITEMYINKKMSFDNIAKELNTYANKIRRDAKKFNIAIRNKSDAQKNALNTGVHKHPTKGTARKQSTKHKIGEKMIKNWSSISDAELQKRKDLQRKKWNKLPDEHKQKMLKKANHAVRKASVVGSKLEKFLLDKLISNGYRVDFHKEQVLSNTKLQLDLFMPTMNVVIEVDGPSHFLPVWGDDTLAKNKKYDQKKEGLILGRGWKLIRIKQTKDFCNTRAYITYNKLAKILECIDTNKENKIIIED